jgi:hypothetical protein
VHQIYETADRPTLVIPLGREKFVHVVYRTVPGDVALDLCPCA